MPSQVLAEDYEWIEILVEVFNLDLKAKRKERTKDFIRNRLKERLK